MNKIKLEEIFWMLMRPKTRTFTTFVHKVFGATQTRILDICYNVMKFGMVLSFCIYEQRVLTGIPLNIIT